MHEFEHPTTKIAENFTQRTYATKFHITHVVLLTCSLQCASEVTKYHLRTCFFSSSTTSSNNSLGVEPEVLDEIATYAGKSLT